MVLNGGTMVPQETGMCRTASGSIQGCGKRGGHGESWSMGTDVAAEPPEDSADTNGDVALFGGVAGRLRHHHGAGRERPWWDGDPGAGTLDSLKTRAGGALCALPAWHAAGGTEQGPSAPSESQPSTESGGAEQQPDSTPEVPNADFPAARVLKLGRKLPVQRSGSPATLAILKLQLENTGTVPFHCGHTVADLQGLTLEAAAPGMVVDVVAAASPLPGLSGGVWPQKGPWQPVETMLLAVQAPSEDLSHGQSAVVYLYAFVPPEAA